MMQQTELFFVKKPGLMSTFQDNGRIGYQRFGVPVSGAMDQFAMQVANILVGNPRTYACMEVTFIGPELEVCADNPQLIAITGADLEPKVNGQSIPMWESIFVKKGDILSFGTRFSGVRAYIAVFGGYDIPYVFASQSTDVQSGLGKQIEKSMYVKGMATGHSITLKTAGSGRIGLHKDEIPTYHKDVIVSIVEGPHTQYFTKEGYHSFYKQRFTVNTASNRMGYLLHSDEKITLKDNAEIWSDAVPFGGIQIPKGGHPIILMADRQTTGGYPRMGTVLSTDLYKVAQLVPHGTIGFKKTTVEEAQTKWKQEEMFLHKLATFRQGI